MKLIQGYRIPFSQKPPLVLPNLQHSPHLTPISEKMTAVVNKMKEQGILVPAPCTPSFLSSLFLVPKPDGTSRPIFNLKALNKFVFAAPFHLINMHKIPDFLQPKDWLCKIDLSQAYFHLPVVNSQRRFLRLIYHQELLEMTCLPFGLSTAPRTFSMLTNFIAQQLRERWQIRTIVYLDDYLLVHQNPQILVQHVGHAITLMQELGWQINFQKSILVPQKSLCYLGICWNPWLNQKALPEEKVNTIREKINFILEKRKATVKEMQSIVGLLNFASFIVPRGRLRHRQTLMFLKLLLPKAQAHDLPQSVRKELVWWLQNCCVTTPLWYPPPTHFLVTDASDLAWGAQLNDQILWGTWSPAEKHLHSNEKEMLAIFYAIQTQVHVLQGSSVLIQSDNKAAVAHLRKEGGTKSKRLMELTYKILTILDQNAIQFSIQYIPGRYNSHADRLSRHRKLPEWHLLPSGLETVFQRWGVPVIDLFASATAHVVLNYVSRDLKDHQALFHDAFSIPWNYTLAWVFPPPFLVPRVLTHLSQSMGVFLLVVPRWEKVFWRADLESRALEAPVMLTNLEKHLIDTSTGQAPEQVQDLSLEVWKCGGGLNR